MYNNGYSQEFSNPLSTEPPSYGNDGYKPLNEENVSTMQVQSTIVTISPNEPPVRDHLIWSIFNFVYTNFCCLGLLALVFSIKSRDRKLVGDRNGAMSYSSTARSLNIASTTLSILMILILIILMAVGVLSVTRTVENNYNSLNHNYNWGK
ncbi:hypothetical protein GDO86_008718 [Hymenochirus boettgeri]|uniref:Uncharacterized protein n=1 Tax=Hymenochirus boettgeri TaxID=247094 RepID=A0A8T2J1J0_9PIPI|nr:hypothetical protein GDO86_008718 [Hymenochirus boettgeri]